MLYTIHSTFQLISFIIFFSHHQQQHLCIASIQFTSSSERRTREEAADKTDQRNSQPNSHPSVACMPYSVYSGMENISEPNRTETRWINCI